MMISSLTQVVQQFSVCSLFSSFDSPSVGFPCLFFLSLSLRIRQSELSSESDGSDKDELEELEDEDEELEEDGSESGFGFGTVLRQGRTSS